MAVTTLDTIVASAGVDTAVMDTVVHDTSYVILISPENPVEALPEKSSQVGDGFGLSWILTGLILLFAIVAIRFSKNSKYVGAILRDATEVRERRNAFDDTVSETSFLIIVNLLWAVCAGIILSRAILIDPGSVGELWGASLPDIADAAQLRINTLTTVICVGMMILYVALMSGAYALVGNVFYDGRHADMWLRGFLAANGLSVLLFFALALAALCYPQNSGMIAGIAILGFILTKIMFIIKGYRIFFAQISSWVLFLYYLCNLEIVPPVILYVASRWICRILIPGML